MATIKAIVESVLDAITLAVKYTTVLDKRVFIDAVLVKDVALLSEASLTLIYLMFKPISIMVIKLFVNIFLALEGFLIRFVRGLTIESIVSLFRMNLFWFLYNVGFDLNLSNLWCDINGGLLIGIWGLFSLFFLLAMSWLIIRRAVYWWLSAICWWMSSIFWWMSAVCWLMSAEAWLCSIGWFSAVGLDTIGRWCTVAWLSAVVLRNTVAWLSAVVLRSTVWLMGAVGLRSTVWLWVAVRLRSAIRLRGTVRLRGAIRLIGTVRLRGAIRLGSSIAVRLMWVIDRLSTVRLWCMIGRLSTVMLWSVIGRLSSIRLWCVIGTVRLGCSIRSRLRSLNGWLMTKSMSLLLLLLLSECTLSLSELLIHAEASNLVLDISATET